MTAEKIHRIDIEEVTDQERQFYEVYKKNNSSDLTYKQYEVITDMEALSAAEEYKKLSSMIKERDRLRRVLIDKANGKNCMIGSLKMEKVARKGCIDYKSIPELLFVDVEKYRKDPVEYYEIE